MANPPYHFPPFDKNEATEAPTPVTPFEAARNAQADILTNLDELVDQLQRKLGLVLKPEAARDLDKAQGVGGQKESDAPLLSFITHHSSRIDNSCDRLRELLARIVI